MGTRGLRARVRWLDHLFHALLEPVIYKRTLHFVVPSIGLEREFANEYEFAIPRIVRIPNPIDVDRYMTPKNFDRERIRQRHNLAPQDVVLVFTALGQFERKGLPLVLEALPDLPEHVKLMVVGGSPDLVRTYERRAAKMGLKNRTVFVGMTKDLRQYLWSADVFIFPSFYEVFSLSAHEAAAAGLPIIATPVHGLTESFRDQENAFLIESTVDGVRAGIERFISLSETERAEMGVRGRETVQQYHPSRFGDRWKNFYEAFADSLPR
jgi:glycosyltransferase involved in cell wall biosynthesis